ncbi:hypothetical protein [Desulfallas sp. Bu1-1]|jgi:hypothetical protein|nr:hypothetical protein [Desulfallas sp. Bu1-1]
MGYGATPGGKAKTTGIPFFFPLLFFFPFLFFFFLFPFFFGFIN